MFTGIITDIGQVRTIEQAAGGGIELDAEIVVYCRSGRRAGVAEAVLGEAGYTNIRDLEGHWLEWQAAGRPTESEE